MIDLDASIGQYLRLRRALGFTLHRDERYLNQFSRYLRCTGATAITTEAAVAWAVSPNGAPDYHANRLSVIRTFLKWLAPFDPAIQVPPKSILAHHSRRAVPYLYTRAQIDALITQAAGLHSPLMAATYATLIGLLACTGVRVGEAIASNTNDLTHDALTITDSKHGKSRLIPLHPSTIDALAGYARTRTRLLGPAATDALLVSTRGTRLIYKNVHLVFHRLITQAGIQTHSDRCRPRIHDLRHTFAVNTMIDAYDNDRDPAQTLPILATYLGHVSPASTYWYLQAAPELLTKAARRISPVTTDPDQLIV